MKKKIFLLFACCVVLGCSYFNDPNKILRDPHFAEYDAARDKLERKYLNKEISYAEYVAQRDALDEKYDYEVRQRDEKIAY